MPNAFVFVLWLFARGQLRFAQGRFEEAAADFDTLERLSVAWGVIGVPAPPVYLCVAHVAAALDDRERALAATEAAVARARRWGAPPIVSSARARGPRLLEEGDRIAALEEAVAVLDRSPARLARARRSPTSAPPCAAPGAGRTRARALRDALELARRCGAAGLARRAHDELAATGEKVRRYTPIGVESLTPSERRVAELAASGMTNRQIAQTRFLDGQDDRDAPQLRLRQARDPLAPELPLALGE